MKKAYVSAFTESLLTGESFETALTNLKRVLTGKGHLSLLGQILRASSRELESKLKQQIPTVTLAKEAGVPEENIQAMLKQLGVAETGYRQKLDPTLIGGFTLRAPGQYIDASYKSALIRLYRAVTKS